MSRYCTGYIHAMIIIFRGEYIYYLSIDCRSIGYKLPYRITYEHPCRYASAYFPNVCIQFGVQTRVDKLETIKWANCTVFTSNLEIAGRNFITSCAKCCRQVCRIQSLWHRGYTESIVNRCRKSFNWHYVRCMNIFVLIKLLYKSGQLSLFHNA